MNAAASSRVLRQAQAVEADIDRAGTEATFAIGEVVAPQPPEALVESEAGDVGQGLGEAIVPVGQGAGIAGAEAVLVVEAPPQADAVLQSAQRAARLRAALDRLPAEQAEVIRLSFLDERPHAEIERVLGIPLGTVKSRLRLAMMRLRGLLDDLQ